MQNLIQLKQEYLIECDHCDFKIKNNSKDPNQSIEAYLNKPCPKCGKNLLTEKDYADYKRTMKVINWLNKWFSWLTIFSSKKGYKAKGTITIHNEVKLKAK
jgi:DNA-directed RNA polymerase subunit RPC12/RpoP